jgi:hypothetical protein
MVKKPVRSIVEAVAAAADRWSRTNFPARTQSLVAVSARTGYSPPVVEYAFDRLFRDLRYDAIAAVIADELGSLDVLDGFTRRPGRPLARAFPIGTVCILSSRTTVGVAIVPAVFALCAKCNVVVKDREDNLVAAFFDTLAGELAELRASAIAQTWDGESDLTTLARFDAVVAFGSDATLTELSKHLGFATRFIAFGSKSSAGYVTRDSLESEEAVRSIARGASLDLILYETEGCLSLHVIFVERGGRISPDRFSEILAKQIEIDLDHFAPATDDRASRARVAMARDLARFRAGGSARVHGDPGASYLVVPDPPFEEPPFFLPRTIGVRTIANPSEATAYLRHHGVSLEALAVSQFRPELLQLAIDGGASRLTQFGRLQAPPVGTFHGGRGRISEFVRWVVNET